MKDIKTPIMTHVGRGLQEIYQLDLLLKKIFILLHLRVVVYVILLKVTRGDCHRIDMKNIWQIIEFGLVKTEAMFLV